jgi:hypothetical protein
MNQATVTALRRIKLYHARRHIQENSIGLSHRSFKVVLIHIIYYALGEYA